MARRGGNESRKEQLELEQSRERLEVLGDSHMEFPAGFWPDSGRAFLGMGKGLVGVSPVGGGSWEPDRAVREG